MLNHHKQFAMSAAAKELLVGLARILDRNGGLVNGDKAMGAFIRQIHLKTDRLVTRCFYLSILQATTDEKVLKRLLIEGDIWKILTLWLHEAKEDFDAPFMRQLFHLFLKLPVTVALLRSTNCPKMVKQVTRSERFAEIRDLAARVAEKWIDIIRGHHHLPPKDPSTRGPSVNGKVPQQPPKRSKLEVAPAKKPRHPHPKKTGVTTTQPSQVISRDQKDKTKERRKGGTVKVPPSQFRPLPVPTDDEPPPRVPKATSRKENRRLPGATAAKPAHPVSLPPAPAAASSKPKPPPPSFLDTEAWLFPPSGPPKPKAPKRRPPRANPGMSPPQEKSPKLAPSPLPSPLYSGASPSYLPESPVNDPSRKRVRFMDEPNLTTVHLFEMDASERTNVTKLTRDQLKKMDSKYERQMLERARKGGHSFDDNGDTLDRWKRPKPIDGLITHDLAQGENSRERTIQEKREEGVLLALYPRPEDIPDTPAEAAHEPMDPKHQARTIPLEDINSTAVVEDDTTGGGDSMDVDMDEDEPYNPEDVVFKPQPSPPERRRTVTPPSQIVNSESYEPAPAIPKPKLALSAETMKLINSISKDGSKLKEVMKSMKGPPSSSQNGATSTTSTNQSESVTNDVAMTTATTSSSQPTTTTTSLPMPPRPPMMAPLPNFSQPPPNFLRMPPPPFGPLPGNNPPPLLGNVTQFQQMMSLPPPLMGRPMGFFPPSMRPPPQPTGFFPDLSRPPPLMNNKTQEPTPNNHHMDPANSAPPPLMKAPNITS